MNLKYIALRTNFHEPRRDIAYCIVFTASLQKLKKAPSESVSGEWDSSGNVRVFKNNRRRF